MSAIPFEEDDDPVIAEYNVFVKPPLPENRKLVLLQFFNKTATDPSTLRIPHIIGMRHKPESGFYEVDCPIDISTAYDRSKGVEMGSALAKSLEAKKGGTHGLAGGFSSVGPSVTAASRAGRRPVPGEEEPPQMSFEEAKRKNMVLKKQTLSGHRIANENVPHSYVGVFKGNNIHLTPFTDTVNLRPFQPHLDAATEQERLNRANPNAPQDQAPGGPRAPGRAIQMSLKSAMDGVATDTMADRTHKVQQEKWQHLDYLPDDTNGAWQAYRENLLLVPEKDLDKAKEDSSKEDAKGKAKEMVDERDKICAMPDLVDKVAHLRTDWDEEKYVKIITEKW
ncbi:DNA-directed RNA polymerase III subunit Rpc5 [Triangularia verruculosa]|uniref:DNA-directed RNA polymerase III subunit Rpc5 n=1 Tax=Triangularia verruculosa TaxID=2587418 RepID=A0AAN6XCY9_9PEZI|nr:DNA-directed RNA polymerase III subunit Rpc5 [Triangularia verruculosa]